MRENLLPSLIGCFIYIGKTLGSHLCLEVLSSILDADEAEAYLQFEGCCALVVLEIHYGDGLLLGGL